MNDAQFALARDALVVTFALALGGYEIVQGGARPVVLTWITGLLMSPVVLRADRLRGGKNGPDEAPRP